jgi:DNA polymerase-3 subunit alpha
MESLIRCGAFDSLGAHRARLFNGLDQALGRAQGLQKDRRSGQGNLFDTLAAPGATASPGAEELPDCPPWDTGLLLAGEKELMGIYMTGHPLSEHELTLRPYQIVTAVELAGAQDGTASRIVGIVSRMEQKITKNKEPFAILNLETFDGGIEVVAWPRTFLAYKAILLPDHPYLICGTLKRRDEKVSFWADEIYPAADLPKLFAKSVTLRIAAAALDDSRLEALRDCLKRHPGPATVTLELVFPGDSSVLVDCDDTLKVLPDPALFGEVEPWTGRKGIRIAANSRLSLKAKGSNDRRDWQRFKEKRA